MMTRNLGNSGDIMWKEWDATKGKRKEEKGERGQQKEGRTKPAKRLRKREREVRENTG